MSLLGFCCLHGQHASAFPSTMLRLQHGPWPDHRRIAEQEENVFCKLPVTPPAHMSEHCFFSALDLFFREEITHVLGEFMGPLLRQLCKA